MKHGTIWLIVILGWLVASRGLMWGQEALVTQVEEALRGRDGDAVHDFGALLTPQGMAELRQRVAQLRASGVQVYVVTVPPQGMQVDALAESVYRRLNMTADELLIVFDGKRVYGKTLALKGDPQAFQDALQEARPSFQLSAAKGLAHFAQALHDRIVHRRHLEAAVQHAAAQRRRLLWSIGVGLLVLAVGAVLYPHVKQRLVARKQYDDRLRAAERLFQRVALKLPDDAPPNLTAEFLRLDSRLRHCRARQAVPHADLDQHIADLQTLDRRLRDRSDDEEPQTGV